MSGPSAFPHVDSPDSIPVLDATPVIGPVCGESDLTEAKRRALGSSTHERKADMTTGWLAGMLVGAVLICAASPSMAQDKGQTAAAELATSSQAALQQLAASVPLAKALISNAHAILDFPKVTQAGLGVGGQYGEGALLKKGMAVAYYKTTGASFGLQAGGQQYGYAMFF
jgi:hypothetical protein